VSTTSAVGELLRRARESRGLTLDSIARQTKIPLRRLEAIERDDAAAWTHEFYRRAEARTYARAVGVDPNLVSAELERASAPAVPMAPPSKVRHWRAPRVHTGAMLLLLGCAAAALLGRTLTQRPAVAARNVDVAHDTAPRPVASPAESPVGTGGRMPAPPKQPLRPSVPAPKPLPVNSSAPPAPPAAPAAAAAATAVAGTELIVNTDPPGGRITVNGIAWGTAPVTVRHLPAGDKRIRVSKDGYAVEERVVRVVDGQRRTIDVQLRSLGK
jgi:hypothetical protein